MRRISLLICAIFLIAMALMGCGSSETVENTNEASDSGQLEIDDFSLYVGEKLYEGQPVIAEDGVIYFTQQEEQVNTKQGIKAGDTFADVVHAYKNYEPTSVQNLASFDFEFKSLEDCLAHFDEYYTEGAIHLIEYTYYQIDGQWMEKNKALESHSQEELNEIGRYDLTFMFRDEELIEVALEIPEA